MARYPLLPLAAVRARGLGSPLLVAEGFGDQLAARLNQFMRLVAHSFQTNGSLHNRLVVQ